MAANLLLTANKVFIIVLVSVFSLQSAYAQKKISHLKQGEAAKFSGILLSPEAYAELEVSSEINLKKLNLELEKQKEIYELKLKLHVDSDLVRYESLQDTYEKRIEIKDEYINTLEKTYAEDESLLEQWKYELGFATGFAVTLLSFYVFTKAVENGQ